MKNKLGISMIVLVVTIVFIAILASAVAIQVSNSSGKERLSVFVNNVTVIEEYIKSCEILKEEMPFGDEMSKEEVISLISTEDLNYFTSDLSANGDSSTISFKKVDMSKVGIKKEFYGYGKEGANDIFIYSETTGTVYYLMGISYNNKTYFSINGDITNIINK